MKAVKCIWQYHDKYNELKPAFDYFRTIANQAIQTGIEENFTSKFKLHYRLYYRLRSEFHCKLVYGALECAAAKIKLYKRTKRKNPDAKIPYIHKPHLILENKSYRITDGHIRIPLKPRQYVFVKLNYYVLSKLKNIKIGSITVTENKIIITFSKEITMQRSIDFVGIDRNLNNVTSFDTKDKLGVYDLQEATKIRQRYRKIKSKFRRNDARIKKEIFSKYGKKERNRIHQILHVTSKKIVNQNMGIILEDLKGIGKLYRKGNNQGSKFRAKMNSWSFYELQRQIEYKARWLGLSVKYVKANGTSSKCVACGSKMVPEEHRMLFCSCCNVVVDRDINAAKNILARGMRVMPIGDAGEAMVEEPWK